MNEEVDELSLQLQSFSSFSSAPDREGSLKSLDAKGQQSKRRRKFLKAQKERRGNLKAHARGLAFEVAEERPSPSHPKIKRKREEGEEEREYIEQTVKKASCIDYKVAKEHKRENQELQQKELYRDQLMLPEAMVEVPENLDEWIAIPVPQGGKRCLVISAKGRTTARLKNGYLFNRFSSALPCGNTKKGSRNNPKHFCLLDCIYYEPLLTYFVLDIQAWSANLYYECDTEFRRFWVQSKIGEIPELSRISKFNSFHFKALSGYQVSVEGLKAAVEKQNFGVDGVLFYHRDSHYTPGLTPLVHFLPSSQIPSLLSVVTNDPLEF